jgi:isoleucyl-tRNA synthetase
MAKGLIKDLARRLQTLRKERGYNPTDILNKASILDLDSESLEMIKGKEKELAFLVRVNDVNFSESCKESSAIINTKIGYCIYGQAN